MEWIKKSVGYFLDILAKSSYIGANEDDDYDDYDNQQTQQIQQSNPINREELRDIHLRLYQQKYETQQKLEREKIEANKLSRKIALHDKIAKYEINQNTQNTQIESYDRNNDYNKCIVTFIDKSVEVNDIRRSNSQYRYISKSIVKELELNNDDIFHKPIKYIDEKPVYGIKIEYCGFIFNECMIDNESNNSDHYISLSYNDCKMIDDLCTCDRSDEQDSEDIQS